MNPIIEVLAPFKWSDNGYDVTEYRTGDIVEVSRECADVETDLGNAKLLTAEEMEKAQAAHAKLQRAATKARAAATKAAADAEELAAAAEEAERAAAAARVGRTAEEAAAALPDEEQPTT